MPPTGDDFPVHSRSLEETRAIAGVFAANLKPGDIVALQGDLGSGKTEFVRGACEALGIQPENVSSPSFTIVNEYLGGHMPVYHFDAYRIKSPDEFFELGYEEYFFGNGVCFVEWPQRVTSLLECTSITLQFEHIGPTERLISDVSKTV